MTYIERKLLLERNAWLLTSKSRLNYKQKWIDSEWRGIMVFSVIWMDRFRFINKFYASLIDWKKKLTPSNRTPPSDGTKYIRLKTRFLALSIRWIRSQRFDRNQSIVPMLMKWKIFSNFVMSNSTFRRWKPEKNQHFLRPVYWL